MAESTKNMTVGAGNASASVTATVTDQMPGVPCPTSPGYEYTGMRYVPVFADPPEWSSANTYEALEIVVHEGNSYTSKIPVPVGIDISNGQYWVLTGNYNAQVESYRKEVEALKASTEKGFSEIRAYVAQEVDTTAVYIGNSYTEGVGGTSSGGLFGQTSKMFTNAFKYTSSGAGFLINSVTTESFNDLLNKAIQDTKVTNSEVTHLILIGAWGDSRSLAELGATNWINQEQAAMKTLADNAKANFPNLRRIVYYWAESRRIPIINTGGAFDSPEWSYRVHNNIDFMTRKSGIEYGGWIGWSIWQNQTAFSADNYHPNDIGYGIMGEQLIKSFHGDLEYFARTCQVKDAYSSIIPGITGDILITDYPDRTLYSFNNINMNGIPDTFTIMPFNTATVLSTLFNGADKTMPSHYCPYAQKSEVTPVDGVMVPSISRPNADTNFSLRIGTRINSGNIEIYGIQYNNSFPTDKSKLPISTYSVYNPKTFILPHNPYYVQK